MRGLSMMLVAVAATAALWAPAEASAHDSVEPVAGVVTTPAPAPVARATPSPAPAGSQPPIVPSSGDSTTAADALTIVGFSIVAMIGLVLVIRAGLRSAGTEDDD